MVVMCLPMAGTRRSIRVDTRKSFFCLFLSLFFLLLRALSCSFFLSLPLCFWSTFLFSYTHPQAKLLLSFSLSVFVLLLLPVFLFFVLRTSVFLSSASVSCLPHKLHSGSSTAAGRGPTRRPTQAQRRRTRLHAYTCIYRLVYVSIDSFL